MASHWPSPQGCSAFPIGFYSIAWFLFIGRLEETAAFVLLFCSLVLGVIFGRHGRMPSANQARAARIRARDEFLRRTG
jgi:hypothetical protein